MSYLFDLAPINLITHKRIGGSIFMNFDDIIITNKI